MERQKNLWNFDYNNKSAQNVRVSPEAPFNWKLLQIDIVSAKGIWKNVLILQVVGGSYPATPTPPVIRVVLLNTESMG